jgi:hypothetical protein
MSRYNNYRILNNSNEYYRKLRQERNNIKNIRQYETPILRHPSIAERANMETTQIIWSTGDRLYKLAQQYYNDVTLWWIIAWYNGRPTEVDFLPGDLITIPLSAEKVIETFGI